MTSIWARSFVSPATRTICRHYQNVFFSTTSCQLGRLKEALQAVLESSEPLGIDSTTYSSVLQLCIDGNARAEGRLVHDHLRNVGYETDLRLDNKLILFHCRVGDVCDARKVFDNMFRRSVVSWTAMISGYSQNGCAKEALGVFSSMRRCGFECNEFTFGAVLRACTAMGCAKIASMVHGCVMKCGYLASVFVQGALIDWHAKCGSIKDAQSLFYSAEDKDLVSWNTMVGGYAAHGLGMDALHLFQLMLRGGVPLDNFTFASICKACGKLRSLANVIQIHSMVIQLGLINDNVVSGSLIDAYAKCRSMSNAKHIYDSLPNRDLISCTALITGYSQESKCSVDALELFSMVNQVGVELDCFILCSFLSLCSNLSSMSLGTQIHAYAVKSQPGFDLAMNNALINMYAKGGEIKDARRAFDEMQNRNVVSWTSLINGYGKHGYGKEAVSLFEEMECQGLKPNDITFLTLISACSHSGLTSKGWNCFNSMVNKYDICPSSKHYSCIVDLLARGGQLEEAYQIVCKMVNKPNISVWGSLLGGCRMHGNHTIGKAVADYLFAMAPHNSVNYVVLSNIYATSGMWVDACKTRNLMEMMYAKKNPGWSLLDYRK